MAWWRSAGVALAVVAAAHGPAAQAQTPYKHAAFDATQLTPARFRAVLEPIARAEIARNGRLMLYNFAGNFDAVWSQGLVPRFTARYGIPVEVRNVRQGPANQQLIAAHRAGRDAPADLYFAGSSDQFATLRAAGVVPAIDLVRLLPQAAALQPALQRSVFGIDTGGAWPVVHLNQTAIGYDSAVLPEAEVPRSFDALLAWAERHPGRFVMTSPVKGGSGSGFLYAAALHAAADAGCRDRLRAVSVDVVQARRWALADACLAPLWRYMQRLLAVAELSNGNADTLNLLNNGAAWIGTVWENQALSQSRRRQLPAGFRVQLLDGGQPAGGDALVVTADARSPAAALLLLDMALERDFQLWKLREHGSRSPRSDIDPAAELPADAARHMLPPAEFATRSLPINWPMAKALSAALEDRLLTR